LSPSLVFVRHTLGEGRAGCKGKARPTVPGIREALGHELVYVVVVAVLHARADAPGPRGPQAVADPALAEGRHPRGWPVRGIVGKEGVGEIVVLDLDCVARGGYPRKNIPVPTHGGEGGIVLVFPSEVGTPMSGRNLYRAFKIRVKRASLPQTLRFHDLRHTCATLLLRQGINPKFVQELLGHADISLTLNTYSHVLPDMGDAAAGGMDAALG
jgi:hypothetical protein